MKICFYISDYGYGHAARDIAIVRRIQKDIPAEVIVKTNGPFAFVEQSLSSCRVMRTQNDIGPVFREASLCVDREATRRLLDDWVKSWDGYISSEVEYCRSEGVELILSDISPQPFLVADTLEIPAIGISNFTWYYIFSNLFGRTDSTRRLLEAYSRGSALLLPFNEDMRVFARRRHVSLVSRKLTAKRESMRSMLGIKDDDFLVYLGLGRSVDTGLLNGLHEVDRPGFRFLLSSHVDILLKRSIKIPPDETETQNYISLCDLVVSKAGYSTVSEAVRSRTPMLLVERDGYAEDALISREVERLGIGERISRESFLDGGWMELMKDYCSYLEGFDALGSRFSGDGTAEVVGAIKEALA